MLPLVPANGGGSYASLAQTFGVQRIEEGKGAFIRVISQQRVVIQVSEGEDDIVCAGVLQNYDLRGGAPKCKSSED